MKCLHITLEYFIYTPVELREKKPERAQEAKTQPPAWLLRNLSMWDLRVKQHKVGLD